MNKDFLKGINIALGFLLVFSIVGIVSAVGFHYADEILPGTFVGDFVFDGDVNLTSGNDICLEGDKCLSEIVLPVCATAAIQKSGIANSYSNSVVLVDSSTSGYTIDNIFTYVLPSSGVQPSISCQPGFYMVSCQSYMSADSENGERRQNNKCSILAGDYYDSASAILAATCCLI